MTEQQTITDTGDVVSDIFPSVGHVWMLAVIAIVSALDAVTTFFIISLGGHEINPIMAQFYPNPFLLVLIKVIFVAVIYGMATVSERISTGFGWVLVTIVVVVTSFSIVSNSVQLMRYLA